MKNKIILTSFTLLSAVMVAACSNGEKKAPETTATPTTEGSTTGNTTTVVAPTPGTTTTTPSPELPNTGSIRDAYWVLSAIFATIGAIVFVTNKKAEEK